MMPYMSGKQIRDAFEKLQARYNEVGETAFLKESIGVDHVEDDPALTEFLGHLRTGEMGTIAEIKPSLQTFLAVMAREHFSETTTPQKPTPAPQAPAPAVTVYDGGGLEGDGASAPPPPDTDIVRKMKEILKEKGIALPKAPELSKPYVIPENATPARELTAEDMKPHPINPPTSPKVKLEKLIAESWDAVSGENYDGLYKPNAVTVAVKNEEQLKAALQEFLAADKKVPESLATNIVDNGKHILIVRDGQPQKIDLSNGLSAKEAAALVTVINNGDVTEGCPAGYQSCPDRKPPPIQSQKR